MAAALSRRAARGAGGRRRGPGRHGRRQGDDRAGLPDRDPAPRAAVERELLDRYVAYSERADARGLAAVLHEDIRFSMPPQPGVWTGRDSVVQGWIDGGFGSEAFGSLRCVVTRANRQPAVACYVKRPGDDSYAPMALDVVRIEEGAIAEIVTFGAEVFAAFGLPRAI